MVTSMYVLFISYQNLVLDVDLLIGRGVSFEREYVIMFVLKCFVSDASSPFTKTRGVAHLKPFVDAKHLRVRRLE